VWAHQDSGPPAPVLRTSPTGLESWRRSGADGASAP